MKYILDCQVYSTATFWVSLMSPPHFFSVAVVLRWTWGFARVVLPLPYNPLFSRAKILAWSHLEGGGVDN